MTFGEMLVSTHPNANIGYIIINNKQYPLYTYYKSVHNVDFCYWLNKDNIIYNHGSAFAVLSEASFTNLPTILDRISFTVKSLSSGETYCGTFCL